MALPQLPQPKCTSSPATCAQYVPARPPHGQAAAAIAVHTQSHVSMTPPSAGPHPGLCTALNSSTTSAPYYVCCYANSMTAATQFITPCPELSVSWSLKAPLPPNTHTQPYDTRVSSYGMHHEIATHCHCLGWRPLQDSTTSLCKPLHCTTHLSSSGSATLLVTNAPTGTGPRSFRFAASSATQSATARRTRPKSCAAAAGQKDSAR